MNGPTKDVEELLHETLTDPRRKVEPAGGLYETVRERARARQRRRLAGAAAGVAVVVLAATGSALGVASRSHRAPAAGQPSGGPSAPTSATTPVPPQGTLSTPVFTGPGQPTDLALGYGPDAAQTPSALYVLSQNPSKVVRMFTFNASVEASADGPSGTPSRVVVGTTGPLWAWSQDTGQLRAYDPSTLASLGAFDTKLQIFDGAVLDGRLWLATSDGLTREDPRADSNVPVAPTTPVSGVTGSVIAIAADQARDRVIIAVAQPADIRIEAIDARTGIVTKGATLDFVKASIAVVGDQVWVGGYASGDTPRLVHLDIETLEAASAKNVENIGPGAIVWPGESVLWVGNGGFVDCVDPKTGATLEHWRSVQGPVVSAKSAAVALNNGEAHLLTNMENGCAG